MVYLWHPDAIDTFDDHLGDVSNFYDTTVQSLTGSEDTWITGITLKHWRLLGENETEIREAERNVELREITLRFERLKAKEERKLEKSTAEERARWEENGERSPLVKDMYDYRFPPPSVQLGDSRLAADAPWGRNADPAHRLSTIHELGLSLVISGDQTGRSWTCSIVCELFDEDEVAKYAGEVSHTLQMFIHQQATGRQLAFLLLLGYLCERLAEECECFMQALDGIMRYNVSSFPLHLATKLLFPCTYMLCQPTRLTRCYSCSRKFSLLEWSLIDPTEPCPYSSRCSGASRHSGSSTTNSVKRLKSWAEQKPR